MKKLGKIKFWSLLVVGIILIFLGAFFFITKKASTNTTNLLFISGLVQLCIFYGLLFYLYKGKIKNAIEN
jgi:uncharacterized membrane protein HdeD (DUF308 family)